MSRTPSFRPLYNFLGWVIQEIKFNTELVMVRLRRDHRLKIILGRSSMLILFFSVPLRSWPLP